MLSILAVSHFRNLEPLKWGPGAGSHLILGGNGAGKTSVLEAIYVAATTRSFRTSRLQDCLQHGTESFFLDAEVETDRRSTLEVRWVEGKRVRLLNGKTASLAEHLGALPVVAWTSAEAEVLVGAPKARRRFMDRGVVGSRASTLEALSRYRDTLAHKRQLLMQGGEDLHVWNHLLAAAAAEVIRLRHTYVERLREMLVEALAASGLPFPPIEARYRPSPTNGLDGADAILANLERVADRERRRQLPLVGPHRDDLEILWGGHDIRRVASAGERKAFSLLLLAAHGRALEAVGTRPVYLLDDADAELSPQTHAAVWGVFKGVEQVIATSNRPQVWLTLEVGKAWEMERGRMGVLE